MCVEKKEVEVEEAEVSNAGRKYQLAVLPALIALIVLIAAGSALFLYWAASLP